MGVPGPAGLGVFSCVFSQQACPFSLSIASYTDNNYYHQNASEHSPGTPRGLCRLRGLSFLLLRCWRRLLRVPWTARRSNQSILKELSPGCSLEGLMLKLKLQYFGHLMRLIGKDPDAGKD